MKYNIKSYPDNTKYVQVAEFSSNLVFRINSYEDLWLLSQLKDVCDHNKQEINLIIPNLLDAQADRRFNSNESSGLKLVCKFINSLKFKSVSIFHPHNQEVVEALIDGVIILENTEFIKNVFKEIKTETFTEDTILLSSDAGGFKPLMKLADKLNWRGEVYSASKARKYNGGKSELTQIIEKTDFEGRDILIIDDICVFGGTFVGLAKMLKERNVGKLYLAVSHITVPNPNPELFELFDCVFTTDSKPQSKNTKLKIIQIFD